LQRFAPILRRDERRELNSEPAAQSKQHRGRWRAADAPTMLTTEQPQDTAVVFQGTRSECQEFGLVLEAKSLPYELVEIDHTFGLLVRANIAASSREELTRYAQERSIRREEPPALVPFAGAGPGAIAYASILLTTAYFAGIDLFDANWFSAGALEKNGHGGHDWWRAVTALTLHVDQLHLLGNLMFGIAAGVIVSTMFGPGIAWASILVAGALGNYLEMLIAPLDHRAVGASTAVFAALGLLSGFGWRRRLTLRERWLHRWAPLISGSCLLTLLGVGTEHVDVLGHLLGFLTGVVLGWIYARAGVPRSRDSRIQIAAAAAAVATVILAWVLALRH
jgi:membrane associated rhomboid family serine protease